MQRAGLANLLLTVRATKREYPHLFSLEAWSLCIFLWVVIALVWSVI